MTTRYTEDHEWISLDGDVATIGITAYAAGQLGDVVFVELPDVGKSLKKGDEFAVVESVKAASEVYAPVDGEIVESDALEALDKRRKHTVEAVIDRIVTRSGLKRRVTDSAETALRVGEGTLIVSDGKADRTFTESASGSDRLPSSFGTLLLGRRELQGVCLLG